MLRGWLKLLPFFVVCWLGKKKAGKYILHGSVVAYEIFEDYWLVDVKESRKLRKK